MKEPIKVMIVEDEQDICILLSLLLKEKNLAPSCSNTIAAAKKDLANIQPSLLFLDNRLPDGSGIDFITDVKHDFPFTKIIVMTAHNSAGDIEVAMSRGADYFISKPFNSAIIRSTIDDLNLEASVKNY